MRERGERPSGETATERRLPERRCVACGTRAAQATLLRLHVEQDGSGGSVVFDRVGEPRRGRGAYLCPSRACLERALKKRVFSRVFRCTVKVDEELLRTSYSELMKTTTEG